MAYCTLQDITNKVGLGRVVQWSDDEGQGVVNPVVVAAAITNAEDTINAELSKRFLSWLPFTTPPRMIFQIAVTLASINLAGRMQEIGEAWQAQAEEAKTLLVRIANGEIELIATDGTNLTKASEQGLPGAVYLPQMTETDELLMPSALLMYRRHNAGLVYP